MNTAVNYNVNGDDTLAKALRRIRRYFIMAFQKLILLEWSWRTEGIGSYGATDGRNLFLHPEGMKKIERTSDPVGYLAFLLIHEALHALLNHALRLAKLKNHTLANVAADYVINAIIHRINQQVLKEEGFIPFPMIDGVLHDESISYDSKGDSLCAEVVYQNLAKGQQPEQDQPESQTGDGEQEEGEQGGGSSSDQSDSADGSEESSEDGGDTNSDDNDSLSDEDILGGDFVGTGADDLSEPSFEEGETAEQVDQQIEIENEKIEIQAKANEAAGIGNGGGAVIDFAEARRNRKGSVDFSETLSDLLRDIQEGGFTKPFNAQLWGAGIVARGRGSKAASELVFMVDLSGSNFHEAADMISRCEEAFDSVDPEVIHLVGFDSHVTDYREVFSGEKLPTRLNGGGGTNIARALDWVNDRIPHADAVVCLTDGYDHWGRIADSAPDCPMVWLNYGDDRWLDKKAYSFGERIDVDIL